MVFQHKPQIWTPNFKRFLAACKVSEGARSIRAGVMLVLRTPYEWALPLDWKVFTHNNIDPMGIRQPATVQALISRILK